MTGNYGVAAVQKLKIIQKEKLWQIKLVSDIHRMERHCLELLNLQILAERAVNEQIQRMRELESQLSAQCCRVCGDRASGRHYGVPSCDGCRGFFKRSVRRNIGYTCKYTNSCVVDMKRRNQCQFCRFQRCLMVGMNRHAVQHERLSRRHRQLLSSTTGAGHSTQSFSLSPNPPPMPQLPCIADMATQGYPSPSMPTVSSLFYNPLSPGLGSPTMVSPPMLPPFSRFALFPPPPPLYLPRCSPQPIRILPMPKSSSTPRNPISIGSREGCLAITEHTPPSEGSSASSPPGSPATPHSKRSSEYSIDSLLKVADGSKRKVTKRDHIRKDHELHLTPPSTPPRTSASPSAVPQYQAQVQQSLIQILTATMSRMHNIPAFRELNESDRRKLVDASWLPIFLVALYEFDFPIESLSLYMQSVSERQPDLPALEDSTMKKIEEGLVKLKELAVDRTETAYIKALALFNPAHVGNAAKSFVDKVQEQAQCMLAEYDRNYFPESIARNGKLILALTNLQNLDKSVSRLLFANADDVDRILSKAM